MSIWDYFTKEERERIGVRYANNPPRDGYQPAEGPGAHLPPPANPTVGIPTVGHKINADQTVAVATDVFWNEDMATAPRGTKCQLLGAGGVATYGVYNGDPFWIGWAPLPKRRRK